MIEFDDYTILRRLDPGGMTEISLASRPGEKPVILRCMKPDYARKRRWRKMFFHGAKVLQVLDHPNVVRIIDVQRNYPLPYMVLEYVPSKTLRSRILNRDPLIHGNLLRLLRQMAAALGHVHSSGYLHLDFKPENLLVDDNAHVTLIDFDLAMRRTKRPARVRSLDGTPFYMPREMLLQRTVDERTDIYALGVTAYEMVVYRQPFGGETLAEARVAQADLATRPDLLASNSDGVTSGLQEVIFKCLAKEPPARYPSMGLVQKALESLV